MKYKIQGRSYEEVSGHSEREDGKMGTNTGDLAEGQYRVMDSVLMRDLQKPTQLKGGIMFGEDRWRKSDIQGPYQDRFQIERIHRTGRFLAIRRGL